MLAIGALAVMFELMSYFGGDKETGDMWFWIAMVIYGGYVLIESTFI